MQEVLQSALEWGKSRYPNASTYRHAAFANSVNYLVTGFSGGYGGPSIREHCVSYALVGDGYNLPVSTNLDTLNISYPDGRIPAGNWEFEQACKFAEHIAYGQLPQIARRISTIEACFDDDPADLDELQRN